MATDSQCSLNGAGGGVLLEHAIWVAEISNKRSQNRGWRVRGMMNSY